MNQGEKIANVAKVNSKSINNTTDLVAVEEPLEILVKTDKESKSLTVTMRTPGNDDELAVGFLFTEGLITNSEEIRTVEINYPVENKTTVTLNHDFVLPSMVFERNFYTTSACGVCGKTSIDSVKTKCKIKYKHPELKIHQEVIYELFNTLEKSQPVFSRTGGLHASALFDSLGNIRLVREDVGRHNALDKLIGYSVKNKWDMEMNLLLLSGRASFELIQKAMMAGIQFVCAIGAPSSLAIEMAMESNITLVGFLRNNQMNIYTNPNRIVF